MWNEVSLKINMFSFLASSNYGNWYEESTVNSPEIVWMNSLVGLSKSNKHSVFNCSPISDMSQ